MPINGNVKGGIGNTFDDASQWGKQALEKYDKVKQFYNQLPDWLQHPKIGDKFQTFDQYATYVNQYIDQYSQFQSTWQNQLNALKQQGAQGAAQLEQILASVEKGDFAAAMNLTKQFYDLIQKGVDTIEEVVKNPEGAALDVMGQILNVLLEMNPQKRSEKAQAVLKAWFPYINWNAPPAVWMRSDGVFVNRDQSNTDYAGRPVRGFMDPFARRYVTPMGY